MKLKGDFFTIQEKQHIKDGIAYMIRLNASHPVYAAHFPGNPVTPGVCIIQIVKELVEEITGNALFLKMIPNIKFLQVIDPVKNQEIVVTISLAEDDGQGYKASVIVSAAQEVFAKLTIRFLKTH